MFVAAIRNGAWRIIGRYARVRGSRFRGCQHAAFQPHPWPAPEFETWLEKMGVMQGLRLQRIDDRHALVTAYQPYGSLQS
jgi:hypothetical protein